ILSRTGSCRGFRAAISLTENGRSPLEVAVLLSQMTRSSRLERLAMKLDSLLDPTGIEDRDDEVTLSPRPVTLRGLTIGLLDNTKANATALLNEIGGVLKESYGAVGTQLY